MSPLCSVVIPAYNSEAFLPDCIRSVQAQSFADLEILVVDDGSTDRTAQCVQRLAEGDARIRYLKQPQNMGVAAARNRGVDEARGEWIAFLDSDDLWTPDKLARQLALADESGARLAYTGAQCIDHDGAPLDRVFTVPRQVTFDSMLYGNDIVCSSVLVRRQLLLQNPMERSDLHEDYITWMRILKTVGYGVGLCEPLVLYRFTVGSKSRGKLRSAVTMWKTLGYLGLPLLKRLSGFCGYIVHGLRRYAGRKAL